MTESEVTTFEVSTINEYVDTISEDESEYASPGLRQKTIEDTEISTVNDNKGISDDMKKVIDMPAYYPEQLADVSSKAKLIGILLKTLCGILALVPLVVFIYSLANNHDVKLELVPMFYIVLFVLSLFAWFEAMWYLPFTGCIINQDGTAMDCIPKTDKGIGIFIIVFLVYDTFKVYCFLIVEFYFSAKLAIVVYIIFNRVVTIGAVFYSKKYCRCSACYEFHRPEDVRIIYGTRTMNMKSKILVTSKELQEYFGISLVNGTHLGLKNTTGELVYDLKESSSGAQPEVGQYLLKVLTVIVPGKPEYSCADCGTCTPWNEIEQQMKEARAKKTIEV